jgi:8-oxo-dGTP pyrophosphatase MutT (NUDIX family)
VGTQLREASTVILLRRVEPTGFEVFFLRRRKGASFMANAFVFPGGAAEAGEDARTAGARELFEEAGVLLARDSIGEAETIAMMSAAVLRKKLQDGANAALLMSKAGLAWSTEMLVPWSHWITPSIEPKRFSARFFVCDLPAGQVPQFDDIETVDQVWCKPADAIARAKELALPPPQIRTCYELAQLGSITEVMNVARKRSEEPHPIMPRLRNGVAGEPPCLLLPWDPEYTESGSGEGMPLSYRPTWATGPSRFTMEDHAWKHVSAPGSTTAG